MAWRSKPYEEYAIRERAPEAKNEVLLAIDMQESFREMATPILPAIQKTIDLARKANARAHHLHDARVQRDPRTTACWKSGGEVTCF